MVRGHRGNAETRDESPVFIDFTDNAGVMHNGRLWIPGGGVVREYPEKMFPRGLTLSLKIDINADL